MKIQIHRTDVSEPQGKHLGAIDVEQGQFRYDPSPGHRGIRYGEISGPASWKLVDLLGQGYGERIFRMEFDGEVLNGCRITTTSGDRHDFMFFDTPSDDGTTIAIPL
ncbi:MAG TPA: hypothetical protein VHX87_03815 [Galbitalea sp.]|jgi:hypothetical protein|nr:hypothetical protein [Galbitalea sp.]